MPFNDKETREGEELFQKHLEIARSLTKKDQDNLMNSVEVLAAKAMKLAAKPSLNDEEEALLERIKKMLSAATENAKALQAILDESLLRQAYAYYHHIKKLAEEGNPEALKIYEDLKPGYQASIKSNLGDN